MAFRHLETSLHHLHKVVFLRLLEDRFCVLRAFFAFAFLKHLLNEFDQVVFFDAQDTKNCLHCLPTP
jgi:hypothetical protein